MITVSLFTYFLVIKSIVYDKVIQISYVWNQSEEKSSETIDEKQSHLAKNCGPNDLSGINVRVPLIKWNESSVQDKEAGINIYWRA